MWAGGYLAWRERQLNQAKWDVRVYTSKKTRLLFPPELDNQLPPPAC